MEYYSIGDISNLFGLSKDTIRYYDKEGLMPFVKRDENQRRVFTSETLGYLEVIDCLKKSGVPIKKIALFMEWCMQGDDTLNQRYEFMKQQEKNIEKEIEQLQQQLDFLKWKKWYYDKACKAGSESIFFKANSNQVDPYWREYYLTEILDKKIL